LKHLRRQIELIEDGGKVIQQTRLYDADRNETRAMRSKEDAMDYRYFPDPDLLPLVITDEHIVEAAKTLPPAPAIIRLSYLRATEERNKAHEQKLDESMTKTIERELKKEYAWILTASTAMLSYIDETASIFGSYPLPEAWARGELSSALNAEDLSPKKSRVTPRQLAALLKRIEDGTISGKLAKEVFGYMWAGEHGADADAIIEARGLKQVTDSSAIEKVIDDVLAKNEKSVAEFKSGKDKAIQALIGQVMKASQGKANPGQVNELLRKKLAE